MHSWLIVGLAWTNEGAIIANFGLCSSSQRAWLSLIWQGPLPVHWSTGGNMKASSSGTCLLQRMFIDATDGQCELAMGCAAKICQDHCLMTTSLLLIWFPMVSNFLDGRLGKVWLPKYFMPTKPVTFWCTMSYTFYAQKWSELLSSDRDLQIVVDVETL